LRGARAPSRSAEWRAYAVHALPMKKVPCRATIIRDGRGGARWQPTHARQVSSVGLLRYHVCEALRADLDGELGIHSTLIRRRRAEPLLCTDLDLHGAALVHESDLPQPVAAELVLPLGAGAALGTQSAHALLRDQPVAVL